MRSGKRAVLRILFCALGFRVVLEVFLVSDCIWDFSVAFERCVASCRFGGAVESGWLRIGYNRGAGYWMWFK